MSDDDWSLRKLKRAGPLKDRQAINGYLRLNPPRGFLAIFMDAERSVIALEELFQGSFARCMRPREVVHAALKHNATNVIFAHNLPPLDSTDSGSGQDDVDSFAELVDALVRVDVRVLDCFIVRHNQICSFFDTQLLHPGILPGIETLH